MLQLVLCCYGQHKFGPKLEKKFKLFSEVNSSVQLLTNLENILIAESNLRYSNTK